MFKFKVGTRVYYDDAPGTILHANNFQAEVQWGEDGITIEKLSDLLTEAEWHATKKEDEPPYAELISTPSPIVELHAGDKVLLCFGVDFGNGSYAEDIRENLTERMPGIAFGLVAGVTGVLIQRKEEG
ncbi:hypothetical protein [Streptomyces sp. SID3212]|uniref:hypothetical protein n=1 Tax=Streptomyces sp. SID3212 TaxID=2690259 RepID=UPI00136F90FD|nr:hypothetical protein [Streptomyces sp. SID3212]MYV58008.1 hypothetical protein [Streptomyces sp. SID3212]